MYYREPIEALRISMEEEEKKRVDELIESGQAVRCTECERLLTSEDRGFEEYLCEKCARRDVDHMLDILQKSTKLMGNKNRRNDLLTIKNFCDTYNDLFAAFLMGEVKDI